MTHQNLIPVSEFCLHHEVEISFLQLLSEYGLTELTVVNDIQFIEHSHIPEVERMIRMHYDLEINLEGIDAITQLLKRMEEIQNQMTYLKNRLSFYEHQDIE